MIQRALVTPLFLVAIAGCGTESSNDREASAKDTQVTSRANETRVAEPTQPQRETANSAVLVDEILGMERKISALLPDYYRRIPTEHIEQRELEFNASRVLSDLECHLAALSTALRTGIVSESQTTHLSYDQLMESKQIVAQLWERLPHTPDNGNSNARVQLATILAAYPPLSETRRDLKQLVERLGLPIDTNLSARLSKQQSTR